jgi:gamma-glutamyltranspeptidase/glutathione hydrolase
MFTWDFPYPSQRMPVLAKNVVATSQPLAAQAGSRCSPRGGNAVDAGLAAAITLTVSSRRRTASARCVRDPVGRQRLVGLNARDDRPKDGRPSASPDKARCRSPAGTR